MMRRALLKLGAAALVAPFAAVAQVQALKVRQKMVWDQVGPISFTQGVPAEIYIGDKIVGAQSIAFVGALPAGVTYNSTRNSLVYDGKGALGSTSGNRLVADDGRP